jgi:hypothetical protein
MPIAVTEYGMTVQEHRAAGPALPALPRPSCPRCDSTTRSKEVRLYKRPGVYVRIVRCVRAGCRATVVLWPTWAAVGANATLDEIEAVVEAREEHPEETWRECAARAAQPHRPSTYRRWVRAFDATMTALLPRLAGLQLSPLRRWIGPLRELFRGSGCGVLGALRAHLLATAGLLLGPLRLFAHVRTTPRPPPSP